MDIRDKNFNAVVFKSWFDNENFVEFLLGGSLPFKTGKGY